MSELVLEIGLEEIPAGFMPGSLNNLETKAKSLLKEARLDYGALTTYGTPRRLILSIKGLAPKQEDLVEKLRGPSAKIAYDDEGNPTKALMGFCRGQGVDLEEVRTEDVKGESYIFVDKTTPGQEANIILQSLLPNIILSLQFPKAMRWGNYDMKYVRPIHWVLALLDDDVIPFDLEVISSGRMTQGHRILAPEPVVLDKAEDYWQKIREGWVLVDPEERQDRILSQIRELEKTQDVVVDLDLALLDEVVHLVEYPTVFLGKYDPAYLALPQDLVVTPMKDHQRYFPVFHKNGDLTPLFVGVRNGDDHEIGLVQKGNEHVLEARLQDALFFFKEDLKADLDQWRDQLKTVVFQDKLGSLYEKSLRNRRLSGLYATVFGFSEDIGKKAEAAADYAKTDLVSLVVGEFPELQGKMGETYLKATGTFSEDVAQAVREHYLPRYHGDDLPQTQVGLTLSIADKMDTIVGCFAAGIEPTGSQDPYGLRRQAAGIVGMILANHLDVSLRQMVDLAIQGLPQSEGLHREGLEDKVYAFFAQRLRTILEERGYPNTFVRAILETGYDRVLDRVQFCHDAYQWAQDQPEAFDQMKALYKRVYNLIVKDQKESYSFGPVRNDLLRESAELALFEAVTRAHARKHALSYREYLDAFLGLTPRIEGFFDDVMVMAEDEDVRQNRLNLLWAYMSLVSDLIRIEAL